MCGIFGGFSKGNVVGMTVTALKTLQHRGQEAFGILTYEGKNGERFHSHRDRGFVQVDQKTLTRLAGNVAIAHVRYSTAGGNHLRNAQPFFDETRFGGVGIAHNGNLTNAETIRTSLMNDGRRFESSSDTEVILDLLAKSKEPTVEKGLIEALKQMKGAYSLIVLTEKDRHIIGVRDPRGFHPLSLGKKNGCYMLASETCVWNRLKAEYIREIEPGEMVVLTADTIVSSFPFESKACAHCIFEQVYFSHPISRVDDLLVSESRFRIGKMLAKEAPVLYTLPPDTPARELYFVSPVPESGVGHAEGYEKETGLRLKRGIIRNRDYDKRTFIQPTDELRIEGSNEKYCTDLAVLSGKCVILVDDSIVRGTTFRLLVKMVRDAGAKEVHIRIASPPFKHRCIYGIDTPSDEELIGSHMNVEEMRVFFNADSLAFVSLDGLRHALGEDTPIEQSRYCTACFSGIYPE